MQPVFSRIGLIGKHRNSAVADTLRTLISYLQAKQVNIILEAETAKPLNHSLPTVSRHELGQHCDLVIVVGGDGSLLDAARAVVNHHVPVLGINRGRLGFLTDIKPDELAEKIDEILAGNFNEERRFLLEANLPNQTVSQNNEQYWALNDVVLVPGDVAHMIEFEIYINQQFLCSERSDGLIIATPTGSTAYALSGGGPILHPSLDAVVLVPMFPHTLSSRPIVIEGNSQIDIVVSKNIDASPRLSCDGQSYVYLAPGSHFNIRKKTQLLRLIHPLDYSYFETLRSKLYWGRKLEDKE